MKTRTRVVAWMFLVYSAYGFASAVLTPRGVRLETLIVLLPLIVQWPFWIAAMARQRLAGYVLIILSLLVIGSGISVLRHIPGTRPGYQPEDLGFLAATVAVWLVGPAICAVFALVTDPPSQWRRDVPATAKRASVYAWAFLLYSAAAALALLHSAYGRHLFRWAVWWPWDITLRAPLVVLPPLWLGVISRRKWSWWAVVTVYTLLAEALVISRTHLAWRLVELDCLFRYPSAALDPFCAPGMLIGVVLPFLLLVRNSPSTWRRSEPHPPDGANSER